MCTLYDAQTSAEAAQHECVFSFQCLTPAVQNQQSSSMLTDQHAFMQHVMADVTSYYGNCTTWQLHGSQPAPAQALTAYIHVHKHKVQLQLL